MLSTFLVTQVGCRARPQGKDAPSEVFSRRDYVTVVGNDDHAPERDHRMSHAFGVAAAPWNFLLSNAGSGTNARVNGPRKCPLL